MNESVSRAVFGFFLVGGVFALIERVFAARRAGSALRRGWQTDVVYWFFTPHITRWLVRVAFVIVAVVAFLLLGKKPDVHTLQILAQGHGPIARQPIWLQSIEFFILGDFLGYWTHRLFHSPLLWRFHAVHHSSTEVDWLAAARVHPFNEIIPHVLHVPLYLLLGFSLTSVVFAAPLLTMYAVFQHANVPWSFGPLGELLASPRFHRWHHSSEASAINKNFSGFLTIWDRLFGTYHMPKDQLPHTFGVSDAIPESWMGQLLYPFRRPAAAGDALSASAGRPVPGSTPSGSPA